jgi:putative Holliday junction resolvase
VNPFNSSEGKRPYALVILLVGCIIKFEWTSPSFAGSLGKQRPTPEVQKLTVVNPRILAIDFGTKRMGLAVSDALGMTAQGLPTLERTRLADDLERLRSLVEEYSVGRVLVGNPIGHSGAETAMSQRVAAFVEKLRRRLPCPVELRDERLTSVEANRTLREAGLSMGKRQGAVDRVAAVLLLQSYLDYLENEQSRESGPKG